MKIRIHTFILVFALLPVSLKGQHFDIDLEKPLTTEQKTELPPPDEIHSQGPLLGRIVGGSNAVIEDYPWQVALLTSSGFQFCGGSVIHPQWILTAAHCLDVSTIYVRAGVTNRLHTTGQDRLVIAKFPHPQYEGSSHINDIALLKLQTPLDLSGASVKAIPLTTAAHAELGFEYPGVMATITGWGSTSEGGSSPNILQVAQVPITTQEYAQQAYYPYVITPDMLPAGFPEGGVDACQGDSGGPIVVPDADSPLGFLLAGATSWGIGCARPGLPGLYSRVSWFEQWITEVSGIVPQQPTGLVNPTQFLAQAVSTSVINLSWDKNADQNNVMIIFSENEIFGTPQDGISYSPGQVIAGGGMVLTLQSATSFNHSGLQPATRYYYKAFSYNSSFEYSSGTTTNAATFCNPLADLPYHQNFNASLSAPECWEIADNVGNSQVWSFGTFPAGLTSTTGYYAYLNSDNYGSGNTQNSDLISPEFDLSDYSDIRLSFTHYFRAYASSSARLQYSVDGGNIWTTLQQWTSTTSNPAYFNQAIPALEGQSSVLFRWKYQGTWAYYWCVDDVSITGTFMQPDEIMVDLKVVLEGAVNPSGNPVMTTSLNEHLPLQQPYNPALPYFGNPAPVWHYQGSETLVQMPDDVVDWVIIELRDAAAAHLANEQTAIGRKAGLLRNNGVITDLAGNYLSFDVVPQNNLFVVVFHRNHLAVISAQPLTQNAMLFSYDFSTGSGQAFGGAFGQKEVAPGVWALVGGDGDANGQIQSQDKNNVWQQQAGNNGYYAGDYIMNAEVQSQDKNEIWEINSGLGSFIP